MYLNNKKHFVDAFRRILFFPRKNYSPQTSGEEECGAVFLPRWSLVLVSSSWLEWDRNNWICVFHVYYARITFRYNRYL